MFAKLKKPSKDSEPRVKRVKKIAKVAKKPFAILAAIGGYFKGSWTELRQVLWPNRKATWSLTAAVLLFTLFFVVLIVLLDDAFKLLFELILK